MPEKPDPDRFLAAIRKLKQQSPRTAQVLLLKLERRQEEEIARMLHITSRTVKRDYYFARAFLHKELL